MQTNQKQLNQLVKLEQKNQLSSEQQDNVSRYQQQPSRSGFRKPIKNPFSQQSDSSNSDLQEHGIQRGSNPFPPKPPQQKSVLQQAQQTMKWTKDQQNNQIQILSKLQGQGMKDKKIRQLANKYKTLNITYEKQRTMRKNIQTQLNTQLKVNEQSLRNKSNQKQNTMKSLDRSLVKDGKCTNPTCLQLQKKVMEFRLQTQNIKTQLNKAHRVLTKQIGQNFNIDQILNDQHSWKGRQQKIQKLSIRVKELQEKLINNGVNVSHMSSFTQMSNATKMNVTNANNNFSTTRTSTLVQNKRKEFDNLKIQVDALKSQNEILLGKVKSINSRKVILQNQMKQLKSQYQKKKQILMEKSQNDDKFINLLKNQNQKLKKQQRVITKVVYKDQKDNQQVSNYKKQIQRLKGLLKKAQRQSKQKQVKQQKCIDKVDQNQNNQKIQIKFPPTQKRKSNIQRPESSSKKPQIVIQQRSQRQISAEKKKLLQNQYVKGDKYLKKLTAEEQISIYQNWKSGKRIQ